VPSKHHHKLHYLELTAPDLEAVKKFYSKVFGWEFVDYGPDYTSFTRESAGLDGGFERGDGEQRAALPILLTDDLEASLEAVKAAGATIVVEPFSFPGGRRFQFLDPAGNELSVWTTTEED